MTRPVATEAQRLLIKACLDNGVSFFWRGPGTLLIERSGLDTILPAVNTSGATVLGFEGFEMESTDIHPRLDLIFDASSRPEVRNPLSAILEWPADIWVDVTLRVQGVVGES
jgi:hypothetical protein